MKIINKAEECILSVGMLVATLLVFANVVMRLMGSGLTWSEELVRYLFIVVTFLGVSICIREGSHFSIDLATQLLKGGWRKAADFVVLSVCLIFAGLLVYYGWKTTAFSMGTGQLTPSLRIPMYLVYSVIPLAGVLAGVRYLQQMLQLFKGKEDETA